MRGTFAAVMGVMGLTVLGSAQAQRSSPPPALPDIAMVRQQVADVDAVGRFYHDLLGLESPRGATPWSSPEPTVHDKNLHDMYGVEGRYRTLTVNVPMSDLRVNAVQWSDAKGKPLHPRLQDPGATRLILTVSDVDTLADRLKQGGAKMLASSGKPITVADKAGKSRVAVFEDFNGFFVELIQPQAVPPSAPGAGPLPSIHGAALSVTVADLDQSARFFREALGFNVTADSSSLTDARRLEAFGMKGAQLREAAVAGPDGTPQLHLLDVRGIDRTPLAPLVADPNAALIRIDVGDMASTLAKIKAFPGAKIMNLSGGPTLDGRDLVLIARVPGAATYLQIFGPAPDHDR